MRSPLRRRGPLVLLSIAVLVGACAASGATASGSFPDLVRHEPASCDTAKLRAWGGARNLGAGSESVALAFVNVGKRRCSLIGYPKLQMLSAGGKRLQTTNQRYQLGHAAKIVIIDPGQRAYFLADFSDGAAFEGQSGFRVCPTSAQLQLTPPGGVRSVTLRGKQAHITPYARKIGDCGLVFVSPVATKLL